MWALFHTRRPQRILPPFPAAVMDLHGHFGGLSTKADSERLKKEVDAS